MTIGADDGLGARAALLVAGLTVDECLVLVRGKDFWNSADLDGRVPSVMLTDGPHGLRKQSGAADHVGLSDSVPATCFPVAAALAATWDVDLVREVGAALGREARAEDVAVLLGPGLNMKRHPRGGRNFEYFAEDPVLAGVLAAALVDGVQSQGVAACPKHFAANNQETMRMVVDTVVDERTLREVYLRGFEIVVDRARPRAFMTAYNRVNGTYCSDHEWLVRDVLRGEWGFDGVVMSDWGGTNDRVAALRAGLDLEMPGNSGTFDDEVREALADGSLDVRRLRESAARVVEMALRGDALRREPHADVDHDAHHELARRAAAEATVLLTNDGTLPLSSADGIVVVGAFAETPRYQGAGSSRVNPTRLDSLRDALGADVPFAVGYDADTGDSTQAQRAEAVALAGPAAAVVLVVGVPARLEAETRDRPTVRLTHSMERLILEVCRANPRTVVVLQNGGALELGWSDTPAAVLEAYLGGQASGLALADVLLGRAEPAGRLAESFPVSTSVLPADANFPGAPRQVQYREGPWIGYRFHDAFDVPARFPFGHGLGYTTWDLRDLRVEGGGADRTAVLTVENTGDRAGSTVVQVYVHKPGSAVPRAVKELAGFARVRLAAGERRELAVPLERRVLSLWDRAGRWAVEAGDYDVMAATSSVDVRCTATISVESDDVVTPVPANGGPVAVDAEFAAMLGRPVPVPEQTRPFGRTSTMSEVAQSRAGGVLVSLMKRQMAKMAGDDPETRDLMDGVIEGLPVRGLAAMSGTMSLATLDRVLGVLNGRWVQVLRGR
jgi:beta-glucosidase